MATKQKEDWNDIESLPDESNAKKFRLKNRYLLLTYRTHFDKESMGKYFHDKWKVKSFNMCHENGDEKLEYLHTHCVIDFGESFETTNCRIFDVASESETIHPHIKKLTYRKAYLDAIRYISKEDKEVYIEEESLSLNIYDECEGLTEVEMLKKCQKFTEVPGALALHKVMRKNKCKLPEITLRPWQLRIIETMALPPTRKILWFYEPIGNTGKSVFAKWMAIKYPQDVLVLQQLGGMKDAATIISGAKDWTGKLLIVDLPRAAESKEIYAPLEAIKNGHLNTIKYEGGSYMWDAGHVMVFANFAPRRNDTWSEDRFHVLDYNNDLMDFVHILPKKQVKFAPEALH